MRGSSGAPIGSERGSRIETRIGGTCGMPTGSKAATPHAEPAMQASMAPANAIGHAAFPFWQERKGRSGGDVSWVVVDGAALTTTTVVPDDGGIAGPEPRDAAIAPASIWTRKANAASAANCGVFVRDAIFTNRNIPVTDASDNQSWLPLAPPPAAGSGSFPWKPGWGWVGRAEGPLLLPGARVAHPFHHAAGDGRIGRDPDAVEPSRRAGPGHITPRRYRRPISTRIAALMRGSRSCQPSTR